MKYSLAETQFSRETNRKRGSNTRINPLQSRSGLLGFSEFDQPIKSLKHHQRYDQDFNQPRTNNRGKTDRTSRTEADVFVSKRNKYGDLRNHSTQLYLFGKGNIRLEHLNLLRE